MAGGGGQEEDGRRSRRTGGGGQEEDRRRRTGGGQEEESSQEVRVQESSRGYGMQSRSCGDIRGCVQHLGSLGWGGHGVQVAFTCVHTDETADECSRGRNCGRTAKGMRFERRW